MQVPHTPGNFQKRTEKKREWYAQHNSIVKKENNYLGSKGIPNEQEGREADVK